MKVQSLFTNMVVRSLLKFEEHPDPVPRFGRGAGAGRRRRRESDRLQAAVLD